MQKGVFSGRGMPLSAAWEGNQPNQAKREKSACILAEDGLFLVGNKGVLPFGKEGRLFCCRGRA
ncbi:hypothetical protein D3Z51_17970 [Clostridiaceae bacterium]|nr:hypothetical protein [Clostridiaceae bacterium]RKI09310.1 hypothetical protein D7V81_17610 [bacterium 1XD21-70]